MGSNIKKREERLARLATMEQQLKKAEVKMKRIREKIQPFRKKRN